MFDVRQAEAWAAPGLILSKAACIPHSLEELTALCVLQHNSEMCRCQKHLFEADDQPAKCTIWFAFVARAAHGYKAGQKQAKGIYKTLQMCYNTVHRQYSTAVFDLCLLAPYSVPPGTENGALVPRTPSADAENYTAVL